MVSWPEYPYKGLSYYTEEDVPLFAGREEEVGRCADLLSGGEGRILILHGSTGCGKSSFLRAGLIPALEAKGFGFHFLKDTANPANYAPLFVRSTNAPLQRLAEAVYAFASRGYEAQTPIGKRVLDLSPVLDGLDLPAFRRRVGQDGQRLFDVLSTITAKFPRTLTLIIDQAEEVLTLNKFNTQEGSEAAEFFQLLRLVQDANIHIKIIISLRTEYYGRFVELMNMRLQYINRSQPFLLQELSQEGLERAILRPTLKTPVEDFGIPYECYRFEYAPGLARRIGSDLRRTVTEGGVLPVLQVVCRDLYQQTYQTIGFWMIDEKDYREIGSVEGRVARHLEKSLRDLCVKENVEDSLIPVEVERWKMTGIRVG
jgi:hypothetical protein